MFGKICIGWPELWRITMRKSYIRLLIAISIMLLMAGCTERQVGEESLAERETVSCANDRVSTIQMMSDTVPVLEIRLNNITLDQINSHSKYYKYAGNSASIITTEGVWFYEDVQIKGRGNATWDWVKKPYQIRFEEDVALMGMGKSNKWILLANYRDVSLMRNEAAFYLAREMNQQYSVQGDFVDLYVDEEYIGLYYIVPKIQIDKTTINLSDEKGILVEIDQMYEPDGFYVYSSSGTCLSLVDSVLGGKTEKCYDALKEFKESFDRFELAAKSNRWDDVEKEIDVESFVQYFLISEFTANPDSYLTSFYLYKDGPDDVIHAGPSWDFDMAFANPKYTYGDASSSQRSWVYADPRDLVGVQSVSGSEIFGWLLDIPEFRREVETYYLDHMRKIVQGLPNHLVATMERIMPSALSDQDMWRENSKFTEEAMRLVNWCSQRAAYMDFLYGSRCEMIDGTYDVKVGDEIYTWYFEKQSDASYCIVQTDTEMVLGVNDASLEVDAEVSFQENADIDSQRWFVVKDIYRNTLMVSKNTGLVLSLNENGVLTVTEYSPAEYADVCLCP